LQKYGKTLHIYVPGVLILVYSLHILFNSDTPATLYGSLHPASF